MVCKIERPTPQALFDRLKDMFSVNVLGGAPVIPESNEWYVTSNDYATAELFYAFAEQMAQDMDPSTACCESLLKMAARRGMYPRPASFAEGYIKVTGTPGAVLPASLTIATSVGNFTSVGTMPAALDGSGIAYVRIRATTPGASGNSDGTVTTGQIASGTVAGINREVVVCGGNLCGGADAESCEAFRTRYLDRLAYKPRATNSWIMSKFLEWPCATRVFSRQGTCCKCTPECGNCGCVDCGGKQEFYVMFDGSFPCGIPPGNVINDLNTWMFGEHQGYGEGQVEMGVCGRVVAPIAMQVDIRVDIVGCITATQQAQIITNLQDAFAQLPPSTELKAMALRLAIAEVIGPTIDTNVEFVFVNPADAEHAVVSDCCGDLEPACDYLPCLRNIIFVAPDAVTQGGCA